MNKGSKQTIQKASQIVSITYVNRDTSYALSSSVLLNIAFFNKQRCYHREPREKS